MGETSLQVSVARGCGRRLGAVGRRGPQEESGAEPGRRSGRGLSAQGRGPADPVTGPRAPSHSASVRLCGPSPQAFLQSATLSVLEPCNYFCETAVRTLFLKLAFLINFGGLFSPLLSGPGGRLAWAVSPAPAVPASPVSAAAASPKPPHPGRRESLADRHARQFPSVLVSP